MAAINLTSAAKKAATGALATTNPLEAFGGAGPDISSKAGAVSGIASKAGQIGAAALGGSIGGFLKGKVDAAFGDLLGATVGNDLLNNLQAKLGGIISNAPELNSLFDNPLKLIEKGAADLAGITGGEFGPTIEQYNKLKDGSAYDAFNNDEFAPSYLGDDSSASKIPNPLRNHNGCNYVITLGVLGSAEYNDPSKYRDSGGFKNYIIKSSGGDLARRTQVLDETVGGNSDHAEYYIEDLEIDAVISPNANTRVTAGTALSFTVIEPYSMGNFIQSIITATKAAGYDRYNEAPFCIKIDFAGWNLGGETNANFVQQPMFIPIKFINMDFNVTGTGSTYAVKAVPMSETGLRDNINKINTPVKAVGTIVHEVLETNDKSVTGAVNSQIEALEETGAIGPYDRYVICFPKTRAEIRKVLQTGTVTDTAFITTPEEREAQRIGTSETNDKLNKANNSKTITITPPNNVYAIFKTFAEDTSLMNEIGLSPLNVDTNAGGNTSAADANNVTDSETGLVDTANVAAQTSDKAREFQFSQSQQITSVIEKILLQSEYCAEKSTEDAKNGMNKWFKIDTQVFIGESPITEAQMGRKPKVYVYSVIPHEIDEAVTAAGTSKPKNTKGIRESAVKEYNYIYTGKNEDVLNFDINFNNAFLMTANSDLGMSNANIRGKDGDKTMTSGNDSDSGVVVNVPDKDLKSNDDTGPETGFVEKPKESAAAHSNDVRRAVAEMFHDRITNMTIDMVSAEMEIMGDPYYVPQQTGNYVADIADKPAINNDGTMNYQDGPVYCIVNFRTPFDYQVTGATMEFPQIVPGFSGLFQVRAVTNKFSQGKFTQTLKMIRRKGQDDKATTGNSKFLSIDNTAQLNKDGTVTDGTVGQSGQNMIDCFPASQNDDVRIKLPAIDAATATALAATEAAKEAAAQISAPSLESVVEGIDFGIAQVPDLTKVIPKILDKNIKDALGGYGDFASGATNAASGALGSINAASAAASNAASAAENAAKSGIAAASGAAKSKIKGLLG